MKVSNDATHRRRDSYLRRKYGLGLADYEEILAVQGGGCAICGKTPEVEGKNLAVDHVHQGTDKGRIRGILCYTCNHRVVGRLRRDLNHPALLRKAADYLDREYHPFVAPEKKRRKRVRKRKSKT